MPTVIALDVSLSMCRPVQIPDCTEEYQRRNLAIHGINTLLDHFSTNCRLEFVSMVCCIVYMHVSVRSHCDLTSVNHNGTLCYHCDS